ncbi:hypothetical protein ES703_107971 [subsurface metagenome]
MAKKPPLYPHVPKSRGGEEYWTEREVNELIWWFDTAVLARNILETLKEEGAKPTVKNAKAVWLDFLETELPDGLVKSVRALIDKGELETKENLTPG